MSVEKSLQRIHWRFSPNEKGVTMQFKPNQNDADALNDVIEYIEREKNKSLLKHQLFAKLYVVMLGEFLNYYHDINIASKNIHKILRDPMEFHSAKFRDFFNIVACEKAHKEMGLTMKPWYLRTKEENEIEEKILEQNSAKFLEFLNKWSQDEINEILESQITNAINLYEAKKDTN